MAKALELEKNLAEANVPALNLEEAKEEAKEAIDFLPKQESVNDRADSDNEDMDFEFLDDKKPVEDFFKDELMKSFRESKKDFLKDINLNEEW